MAALTLVQLRDEMIKLSGRLDLVTGSPGSYADAGIDKFINLGVKKCNGIVADDDIRGTLTVTVTGNTAFATLTNMKTADAVFLVGDDGDRTCLQKIDYRSIKDVTSPDNGTPESFAIYPGLSTLETRGLVLYIQPYPTSNYDIEVIGQVEAPELVNDGDTNYWTTNHWELVVFGALWKLESFYRNTEGANHWRIAFEDSVKDIVSASISREMAGDIEYREHFNETNAI